MDETTFKHLIENKNRTPDPMRFRHAAVEYRRTGAGSGLKLPALSLGLWQNFGSFDHFEVMRDMIFTAFDKGINSFDLANNYGPRVGSAEENFGKILRENFSSHRDEMLIATKAGFPMWGGPCGRGGTRKYLIASLDASLKRMGIDYADIYYHHRPDPETPIEETCYCLHQLTLQGKALYIGISNYTTEQTAAAVKVFKELKTPFILNQARYNLLDRTVEETGLLDLARKEGFGVIAYSPLAQGLLTERYAGGIPEDSRIKKSGSLKEETLTPELFRKLAALRAVAERRGQTLPALALSWVLRDGVVPSVIIGASSSKQILENINVNPAFTAEELAEIEQICKA